MAATKRGTPLSHAHSTLGYQSVHRVKNDHRTAPPAFLRKGLLQLGRVLNAPFRYCQQSQCCAPMAKGRPLGLPWSLGRFCSTSAIKALCTGANLASVHVCTCKVAAGQQACGTAAAAGCGARGSAGVPHPGGALPPDLAGLAPRSTAWPARGNFLRTLGQPPLCSCLCSSAGLLSTS
jgi:hypothetical protein